MTDEHKDAVFEPEPEAPRIMGYPGCRAANLIEVYSITISNQDDGSLTDILELYGDISIIDDADNNTYPVYNRGATTKLSESISHVNKDLSLTHCPIAPVTFRNVIFTLTDKITGEVILDGECHTPFDCEDVEHSVELTLQGSQDNGYYATLVFTFSPFSVIGEIKMSITAPVGTKPIQGKVDGYIRVNGLPCLKNITFKPQHPITGGPCFSIELSRTAVAVPIFDSLHAAYSLQLDDGQDFVTGSFTFHPLTQRTSRLSALCTVDSYNIHISAECTSPVEYFARRHSKLCRSIQVVLPSKDCVEVFSIVVGCDTNSSESMPPALCGAIVVADLKSVVSVFSWNEACPYKLAPIEQESKRAVLSLAWPDDCLVPENNSAINLYLTDVQGNDFFCFGGFYFCDNIDIMYPERHDKRMCVAIKQDSYFAAVHYSVFKNGQRAKVTLEWEGTSNISVYGSVSAEYVTEYSNLGDYRSTYDQKYYRSIIFKRSSEDPVLVDSCSRIPLLKSLVTTPSDFKGLCLHVDLEVMCCEVVSLSDGNRIHNPKLWMVPDDAIQHLRVYHPSCDTCIGYITIKVEFNWTQQ